MSGFRVAHFSDVHVTVPPLAEGLRALHGKRWAGFANYALRRRRAFAGVEARLETLLADVDAQRVDHVLCTGDLTSMAYDAEFERCAALFGSRRLAPEQYTVLPGNHDRYTRSAVASGRFEALFGEVSSPGGAWPFRKDLGSGVTVIGVDVCRPTSLVDSSGWCGPAQRSRLQDMLRAPDLADRFVILALHYALFLEDGRPDSRVHGIRDAAELLAVLESEGARVDLVVHGHVHDAYVLERERFSIACAGSATDRRLRRAGYQIYTIEGPGAVRVERRVWDGERLVFDPGFPAALEGGRR